MKRREFIIQSGTVLTAAALISTFSGLPTHAEAAQAGKPTRRPDPNAFAQPIMKAIAWGVNAPSPHNTQSWKFAILGDLTMLLYVDEQVLLPATDPPSRQIHLGAGCFIETLALAATTMGYETTVEMFPEGYESDQDFGRKPVAHLALRESTATPDPLATYITVRQTNRQVYSGPRITLSEFAELTRLAGRGHAEVVFKHESLDPFLAMFYEGLDVESRTFRTNEETRKLFRFTEQQMAEKGNGLSLGQMGYSGIMKAIVTRAVNYGDPKKWHSVRSIDASMKKMKKGIDSTKGIVFWITPTNTYLDWVQTGRDYARFALALTSQDLYAHPYNQAIQEYDEMKPLRDRLNEIMQIVNPQKIQMVIRIGRGQVPFYSYRRQTFNIKDSKTSKLTQQP
ncbi:hypothetical protein [Persicitalea sp.]|uniref:Acg family FMN-binding oxidoreductase n=1 Tax=Persicitalea sp. TaxID=3100273 RepID=UPI003593F6B6